MPRLIEIPIGDGDVTSGTAQVTGLTATPTGRPGDTWIALYSTGGGVTNHAAPDSSWELVGDTGTINSVLRLSVWKKRVFVGQFPVPFTHDGGSLRAALSVRAIANAAGVEGTTQVGGAGGVTSFTHPSLTALGPDRLFVLATCKNTATGGVTTVLNTPANFTESADVCSAHATNANDNHGLHHKIVPIGGTGTVLVDSPDGAARTWAGVTFLLKPRLLGPAR